MTANSVPRRSGKVWKSVLMLLAGGSALVTTANCDPRTGAFTFFRDTDNYYYDGGYYYDPYYYDGYYYDDCYFFCF